MTRSARGQGLVEYMLLLAAGSIVVVATVTLAGPQVAHMYERVQTAVANPLSLLDSPSPSPSVSGVPTYEPSAAPTPAATPAPIPAPTAAPVSSRDDGEEQQGQQGDRGAEDQHGHHRD